MGTSSSKPYVNTHVPAPLPGDNDALCAQLNGQLFFPGEPQYDLHRVGGVGKGFETTWLRDPEVWGRPSAIAVPFTADHVAMCVKYAVANNVKLCIACGRHARYNCMNDHLMIDLSARMNKVTVDPATRLVTVAGGATIGAVDAACAPHSFLVPVGRVPSTGCAGQMLTTGMRGYVERKYGLGIDILEEATVVVGTGEIKKCSEKSEPDLFWAIKGGGGHYGVVVEMVFKAHVLPNEGQIYCGAQVHLPLGMMGMPKRDVLMQNVCNLLTKKGADGKEEPYDHPDDFSLTVLVWSGGKLAPTIINKFWWGEDTAQGEAYIAEHAPLTTKVVDNTMGVYDYWSGVQHFALGPKGDASDPGNWYVTDVLFVTLTSRLAAALADICSAIPPKGVTPFIELETIGGKTFAAKMDPSCAAVAARSPYNLWILFLTTWTDETGDEGRAWCVNWAKSGKKLLHDILKEEGQPCGLPWYHRYQEEELAAAQQSAHATRKIAIKAKYDPKGVFLTLPNMVNAD